MNYFDSCHLVHLRTMKTQVSVCTRIVSSEYSQYASNEGTETYLDPFHWYENKPHIGKPIIDLDNNNNFCRNILSHLQRTSYENIVVNEEIVLNNIFLVLPHGFQLIKHVFMLFPWCFQSQLLSIYCLGGNRCS